MTAPGCSALIAGLLVGLGTSPVTALAEGPASLRGWISLRHPGVEWIGTAE